MLFSLAPLPKSNPALPFRSISSRHHSSRGNKGTQASPPRQGTAPGEGRTFNPSKTFYRLPCCQEVGDEGRDDVFITHTGVTFMVVSK